jgi:hypothetical protein
VVVDPIGRRGQCKRPANPKWVVFSAKEDVGACIIEQGYPVSDSSKANKRETRGSGKGFLMWAENFEEARLDHPLLQLDQQLQADAACEHPLL